MNEKSPWSPLGNPVFRALWIAVLVSNIGTWMHEVGAGWMMTSLSSDPFMVALVQSATSLPMFIFALPSGVLADIIDRRKYLLFAQVWMLLSAGWLAVFALLGKVTPEILLISTFLLGMGAAMAAPAFQAIMPDLVGREKLPAAVALNSLGVNISRAIGPALGGLILSLTAPGVVFMINAVSVLGVAAVIYLWKPKPQLQRLPAEHFIPAIRSGLRYVQSAPLLRIVLVRSVAFFLFGSAAWALLPLVARNQLQLGAGGYGILLACIGVGAVGGALVLPRLRKKFSSDALTTSASLIFALTMLALSSVASMFLVCLILLFTGATWIAVLSILNVTAQRSSAGWVKARALAVYLVTFFGSMAVGSALWGKLSSQFGISTVLMLAGLGMILSCATALGWKLNTSPDLDLTPSTHLPDPKRHYDPEQDAGPVMVTIEYYVSEHNVKPFIAAAHELKKVRRRSGALSWGIFESIADPGRYVEVFTTESWLDHLRQHERFTENDRAILLRVTQYHRGNDAPHVEHLVAPR